MPTTIERILKIPMKAQVLEGIPEHYPVLTDPDYFIREGQVQSEAYTSLLVEFHKFLYLTGSRLIT
jgi:hypothetical protein